MAWKKGGPYCAARSVQFHGEPFPIVASGKNGLERARRCREIHTARVASQVSIARSVRRDRSCPERNRAWQIQEIRYSVSGGIDFEYERITAPKCWLAIAGDDGTPGS